MLRAPAGVAAACVSLLLATAFASSAHAQGAEECNPAYEAADALTRAGGDKLLDARDKLLVCARPVCKPWMVKECTKSLSDLDARIPSVVLSAKDASGADLVDVRVELAEKTLTPRLDGKAIELGPGEHAFVFVAADGRRAIVQAIIREGEKAQRVAAVFEPLASDVAVPPAPLAPSPGASAPPPPEPPAAQDERPASARQVERGAPILGFTALGIGVVGIGVGAVFGALALGKTGTVDDHCRAERCDPTGLDAAGDARSFATVSTIGFAVGLVAAAGGAYLVLSAPKRTKAQAKLDAGPRGISLSGWW